MWIQFFCVVTKTLALNKSQTSCFVWVVATRAKERRCFAQSAWWCNHLVCKNQCEEWRSWRPPRVEAALWIQVFCAGSKTMALHKGPIHGTEEVIFLISC